ncbi:hypothetical protein [Achromobacter mucicolens]|uniref:hypothetical protein n=1 Tax=Achromobacter mucicolens TaxID=1389922 RepID=UPI0022F3DEB9|nr:hypothetical protein [Achromobacter mucicolens]WBX87946.1 hypothetical protein PE062_21375 [Achromobacter mucicolens]
MPTQTDLHSAIAFGKAPFQGVKFTHPEGLSETIPLEVELANAEPAVHFGRALERAR